MPTEVPPIAPGGGGLLYLQTASSARKEPSLRMEDNLYLQSVPIGCSESYRVKFKLVKSHDVCSVFCSMYQIKAWLKVSLILKHT